MFEAKMDANLIIHQGAIGDLVVSLPAFYSIRTTFFDKAVEVMGYPAILSLIHQRFYADRISSIDRAHIAQLYQENSASADLLKKELSRFQRIFIFGGKSQIIAVSNLRKLADAEVLHILTFPDGDDMHVIDYQLKHLSHFGFIIKEHTPRLFLKETDFGRARELLNAKEVPVGSVPLIAIHPGSGSKEKNWPFQEYLSVMRGLHETTSAYFLIIEGPADTAVVERIKRELDTIPFVLLQNLELPLLASLLQHCSLFIGNDSGITHMAAAVDIPTIAMFGPTDPRTWAPRGERVMIMNKSAEDKTGWEWIGSGKVLDTALEIITEPSRFLPLIS